MATVTQFPTANETGGDGNDWTNPNNAHADDNIDATAAVNFSGPVTARSNIWKTFGFDAVLPLKAVINSVTLTYETFLVAFVGELQVHAIVGGVNQATHVISTITTTRTQYSLDLTADRAWTRADLLDATFKFYVRAGATDLGAETISLDYIRIDVTYVVPYYESGRF